MFHLTALDHAGGVVTALYAQQGLRVLRFAAGRALRAAPS